MIRALIVRWDLDSGSLQLRHGSFFFLPTISTYLSEGNGFMVCTVIGWIWNAVCTESLPVDSHWQVRISSEVRIPTMSLLAILSLYGRAAAI
jgi:hypothetical protein